MVGDLKTFLVDEKRNEAFKVNPRFRYNLYRIRLGLGIN